MWPAAPPTSAPLMQPLASAVAVCAVIRRAAVRAANTNFMRISLLGRLLNETRQREVPTIVSLCRRFSRARSGRRSGTPTRLRRVHRESYIVKAKDHRGQLPGTAVLWAATAVHLRFRRISVAVKSIFGAIGL